MRSYGEIKEDARSNPAFSNGMEWDGFASKWCYRCKFYETCEIVNVAIIEQTTPREWISRDPMSLSDRYECTEFENA